MVRNLPEFERELNREIEDNLLRIVDLQRTVCLDAFRSIALRSPVRTGRYRASHRMAIGVPDTSVEPEGTYLQVPSVPTGLGDLEPYSLVVISNSLPYAEVLENGSSKQAPQGIYALTAQEIEQRLLRARI